MAVIEFNHVTKVYQLGTHRTNLREAVVHRARKLLPANRNGQTANSQLLYALNDVNFKVEQGEILGFIGHNGAGKSTILKLLSKVTYPTLGNIQTKGRMAALIELGAGFHPDLTGRENIYMNGAILGLKKQEIDAQMDSIIDFAGLDRFIETPIKRYSSGMYVRLAFAVASHVRADLLLVDEVLSVGDMAFQQKSLAKMNQLRNSGATIVFVSHNLSAIKTFCSRVILLEGGKSLIDGKPEEVIEYYENWEQEKAWRAASARPDERNAESSGGDYGEADSMEWSAVKVDLADAEGNSSREFRSADSMRICCQYEAAHAIKHPVYQIVARRRMDGLCCFSPYRISSPDSPDLIGRGSFEVRVDQLLLAPGEYTLEVRVAGRENPGAIITSLPEAFKVTGKARSTDSGIYDPVIEWIRIPDQDAVPTG